MPLIETFAHGQFSWVELVAEHLPSSIEFYKRIFEWQQHDLNHDCDDTLPHIQFESDGQPVAGLIQMAPELAKSGMPSVWNSYVCVNNVDETLSLAENLGGKITCPAMNAGEHGRVGFLSSPGGSIIGVWQKGSHGGASLRNELNSVCWNELISRDAAAARQFYGELFGWTFEPFQGDIDVEYFTIRCSTGEQMGGIMQMSSEWRETPSHWSVYFRVDAVDSVTAAVQRSGGAVVVPPFDTPVGRIAILADNNSAAFSIIRLNEEV
ncbi:MAG: VOC family protein [Planctomycetaceae bacterium]|nr:VOC family protein [Planctomycetaceae bacterium]